ncbi:flavin reductase [Micromonospora chersina]|uniref:flavin reductase n=1 Tax=Micromonospora chersina TaxID=47854 RepID=UPI0033B070E0
MTIHLAVTPAWTCGGCGADWPCRTRQRELRAEYDSAPVSLALYLATQLVNATQDLTNVPAGHLHHRFLGWIR